MCDLLQWWHCWTLSVIINFIRGLKGACHVKILPQRGHRRGPQHIQGNNQASKRWSQNPLSTASSSSHHHQQDPAASIPSHNHQQARAQTTITRLNKNQYNKNHGSKQQIKCRQPGKHACMIVRPWWANSHKRQQHENTIHEETRASKINTVQ